jgi:NAD(P)-dependent dehydrogenase (short-subunit alcohol dehydrogenase family)
MLLTSRDVRQFGAVSGDTNPLHLSPDFARTTPFAEPIAHGALACLAALDEVDCDLAGVGELRVTFRRPVRVGVRYRVECAVGSTGAISVTVADTRRCVEIVARSGSAPAVTPGPDGTRRSEAATRRLADLSPGVVQAGDYLLPPEELTRLERRWPRAFSRLGETAVVTLAWCSYLAGMEMPGRFGLLCQVRFTIAGAVADGRLTYRSAVSDVDERFGLVTIDARLSAGGVRVASAEIEAMVVEPVPAPRLALLDSHLPASTRWRGRTAVVTGGSRGLGAAIVLALASQGCRVVVGHRGPAEDLDAVRVQLTDGGEVLSAPGDVADPAWAARVTAELPGRLDYLVVNAAPTIETFDLTPHTAGELGRYVGRALELVGTPLAAFVDRLAAARGRCLLVSSAALARPPVDWAHYVTAKAAAEALVRWYAAHHPDVGFLAVRPGTLHTDQTNTPAMRETARPVEPAAAAIVGLLLKDVTHGGELTVADVQ